MPRHRGGPAQRIRRRLGRCGISGLRPEAYEAAIAQLADGDLLFRIRSVPQRVYGFKHVLVQEAAYRAIPKQRRKELHAQVVALREEDWRAGDTSLGARRGPFGSGATSRSAPSAILRERFRSHCTQSRLVAAQAGVTCADS